MKNIVLILFMLISSVLMGQSNYQDIVYLKNGGIIRGVILEQIPNQSIKIETNDRNVFVFPIGEIDRIAKEPILKNNQGKTKGKKVITELGYQIGIGDNAIDRLTVNLIPSYQFNPYLSLGIGAGVRHYFDAESTLLPVFIDLRATMLTTKVSPYFTFQAGYTLDLAHRHRFIPRYTKAALLGSKPSGIAGVGPIIQPAIGVDFSLSRGKRMHVGLGYEAQIIEDEEGIFGALHISMGFTL